MNIPRVQARGQVTIPQEIREGCGINAGTELLFIKTGPDTFTCKVLPQSRSLVEFTARHASYESHPDLDEVLAGSGEEAIGSFLARPERVPQ